MSGQNDPEYLERVSEIVEAETLTSKHQPPQQDPVVPRLSRLTEKQLKRPTRVSTAVEPKRAKRTADVAKPATTKSSNSQWSQHTILGTVRAANPDSVGDASSINCELPAAKTSAQRVAEYRRRKAEEREKEKNENPEEQRNAATVAERVARHRAKKRAVEEAVRETASSATNPQADALMDKMFFSNEFGHCCDVCDRLWFRSDVVRVQDMIVDARRAVVVTLADEFTGESVEDFTVCNTCKDALVARKVPKLSRSNGFKYPPYPQHLPKLDCVTERLVSPRLPFMQIRQLRWASGAKRIIGQVMNIPVDVHDMVTKLPRKLENDRAINVVIKRHIMHKSRYLEGYVRKDVVQSWLKYLLQKPLYKQYNITEDEDFFEEGMAMKATEEQQQSDRAPVEQIDEGAETEISLLLAEQKTVLWSEDKYLDLALGQSAVPLYLLDDEHCEELSFPGIYLGEKREFVSGIKVTPFDMATSEIRRRDRRAAHPDHILYMAMKIMRIRMMRNVQYVFRNTGDTAKITRKMIEDKELLERAVSNDLSFLRSIPNSATYWSAKKRDVFAMLRQLGKPTMFLTLSASEYRWPHLLQTLYRAKHGTDYAGDIMDLTNLERSQLVNEDPVTCDLYFNKLVDVLLALMQRKAPGNPFGSSRIVDYFKRIEFQSRGSPHVHILLWLADDPEEQVSEDMPLTVKLVDALSSVDHTILKREENQIHQHTFTCYKKNSKVCRFGAPFWPMERTRVLMPLNVDDEKKSKLKKKFNELHLNLEMNEYESFKEFLEQNDIGSLDEYLNVIRAGISRPTVMIKRNMKQIWSNAFNPWLATILNSNMDLQFILDGYACAAYAVEYVNKTNRGISHLHRELIVLRDKYPDKDYGELLKEVGLQVLNSIEMCSQEAAWFLLRLPMTKSSRDIRFINTVWPQERVKVKKSRAALEADGVGDDDTNIWSPSCFERYEKRPRELEDVTLAQFVAHYTWQRGFKKRRFPRVIRFRGYTPDQLDDFKREQVLLHFPFRSELADVLDCNKFLNIYADSEDKILQRAAEFSSGINIYDLMQRCQATSDANEAQATAEKAEELKRSLQQKDADDDFKLAEANSDDVRAFHTTKLNGVIKRRENVMSADDYCKAMRATNYEQRALILESIDRYIHSTEPIQIFFTGPAGCGKTFTMRLMMETYNRIAERHTSAFNAYIACASTGKAAKALDGVTVHSAFKIALQQQGGLRSDHLTSYRYAFQNVAVVFVDEISMIGADTFHTINSRLCQITGNHDQPFGGMNVVMCGDLRQLPPVRATPIYKRHRTRITGDVLWQRLKFYPLVQVMRQSETLFSGVLTKIGNGEALTNEGRQLLENRFVAADQAPNDAIRLFNRNSDVARYNAEALNTDPNAVISVATDTYAGYLESEQLTSMRNKVDKMTAIETAGLPYKITLVVGKPYMITANIDVTDGLVNGAIGVLRYIEYSVDAMETIKRVWLDFGKKVGRVARLKFKSFVQHNEHLKSRWVPIAMIGTTIHLGKSKLLTCRRLQFPLIEACALTIHKSQGGTYDQIVYEYSKTHEQSLVYVALSRVSSLGGLFLTNKDGDFQFHHAKGSANNELRNEFKRLEQHKLKTLMESCHEFQRKVDATDLTQTTINIQSFKRHREDVEGDYVMRESKILALTETMLNNDEKQELQGFRCINQYKRECVRAGGVAVYEREDSTLMATPHTLFRLNDEIHRRALVVERVGDICAVQVVIKRKKVIVVVFYISPGTSLQDTKDFFEVNLMAYNPKVIQMFQSLQRRGYEHLPIVMSGNLNLDLQSKTGKEFISFMELSLQLKLVNDPQHSTTRGGTTIDAVFTRFMDNVECMNYVSYFSYHQPLITVTV